MYLNLAMQDYPQLREQKSAGDFRFQGMSAEEYAKTYGQPTGGEALRLVIGDILSEVLPENPLRVRALDGTPLRAVKRVRFSLGKDAWLFSLLPTGPAGWLRKLKSAARRTRAEAVKRPEKCGSAWPNRSRRHLAGTGEAACAGLSLV